jgi:hypothetical protein
LCRLDYFAGDKTRYETMSLAIRGIVVDEQVISVLSSFWQALRHVFCTRLSWVAADAVVQRAMRHSSPEMKRHYQLGMVDQVRESIERANQRAYQGKQKLLRFYYVSPATEKETANK